ncbi:MAG: hypothetical protein ACOYMR_18195, partial [Ilumatobacteraceae bacterium]
VDQLPVERQGPGGQARLVGEGRLMVPGVVSAAVDDAPMSDVAVIGIIVFAIVAVVGFVAIAVLLWWPRRDERP